MSRFMILDKYMREMSTLRANWPLSHSSNLVKNLYMAGVMAFRVVTAPGTMKSVRLLKPGRKRMGIMRGAV
jgi:hypothetical protein